MAYSVDWLNKIVFIPKADLTVVSASPEIYELDVIEFWAQIHDIQDGEEGMPYPDIMRSNAPFTISGINFVRSVEIINGYQIEFEDGAYQVNIFGANNNLVDAHVANNVSLVTANSAGLISAGTSLTASEAANLQRILDLVEADEEFTASSAIKKHRTTKATLLTKNVSGGTITNPPIVIDE